MSEHGSRSLGPNPKEFLDRQVVSSGVRIRRSEDDEFRVYRDTLLSAHQIPESANFGLSLFQFGLVVHMSPLLHIASHTLNAMSSSIMYALGFADSYQI